MYWRVDGVTAADWPVACPTTHTISPLAIRRGCRARSRSVKADEIVLQFFGPAQPERLEPVAGTPEPHPQAGSERVGVEYLAGGGAVSGEFSRGRCAQFAYGIAPPERHGIPRNGQGHGRFLGAQRFFDDFRDTAAVAQEDALAQVAGLAGGALEQVAPNRLDTVRGALDAEFPPQQGDDAALQGGMHQREGAAVDDMFAGPARLREVRGQSLEKIVFVVLDLRHAPERVPYARVVVAR